MESGEDNNQFEELPSEGEYSDYRSSRSRSRSRSQSRSRGSRSRGSRTRSRSRSRRSRRRSRSRGSDSRMDHEAAIEEAKLLLESDIIKFCSDHGLDIQPSSCTKCKLVTRCVGKAVLPELIKLKKAKVSAADSVPSAAKRCASRLDERPPTLTFTETDLELAVSIFNRGRMSPPAMFDDLTKEFLLLPSSQNEALTKSVHLEKFLYKFKRDKFFSHIFLYVEQMAKIAKHLRITEWPVILAMGELTRFMNTGED